MNTPASKPAETKVILGVTAHPDDLDFWAGGTFAKWTAEGAVAYYLILTNGCKGSADRGMTPADLIDTRRQEQRKAARSLGVKEVFFLDYEDGALECNQALKKDICCKIRELKPDTVFAFDPTLVYSAEYDYLNHPDHRAAGQATLDAIYPLARDHLSFPDLCERGLEPHKVKTVLLSNIDKHNFYVDIESTIDTKADALTAHASQWADGKATQDRMRRLCADMGSVAGCEYAEAFVRINIA